MPMVRIRFFTVRLQFALQNLRGILLLSSTMLRVTVHLLLLLLFQIQGEISIKTIVATNTEVLHELERETSGLKYNVEISTRKEELCMLRQDPENELPDLRYCMELKLEPNTTAEGPFKHFAEYFNWLKLDVVNSVTPGDSVGPLGAQLTFGVSSKHDPKRGKHETVKEQLANTDVVMMLLKEIFGYIAVDCDNNCKSGQCPRNYRTPLLDTVLVNSRESCYFLQLLSRPPFDSFMGYPKWAQFDNSMGFWHELKFYGLEKSQACQYSPLASLNTQDGNRFCDITSVFQSMLTKRSDLWHRHSITRWLTKQFSFLLNHEERQGLFITYCEIGSQKSHSENANIIESAKEDSSSEVPPDCNTDIPAELEMIDLHRVLIGRGAHRRLRSFMKFKYHKKTFSTLRHQFCQLVMMERLQSGIFVDPFELQRLVNRGALDAAYVYGDANLELPSQHSHQSIVEVHTAINVDSGTLSGNSFELELKVDLPLHARYPPLGTESYSVVSISIPHVLLHRVHEVQMQNLKTSRSIPTLENETLSWVKWDRDASHTSEVLKWRIPAGNQLHAEFVTIFTTLSALVSIMAILLASLYSLHYS